MFLPFQYSVYEEAGGFDERYFHYYEDVTLCARLQLMGNRVIVCPRTKVVHQARRSSHHNLRYLRWHLGSMLRFFLSPVYSRVLYRKFISGKGVRA
jgi:GT2 family glycosyltransferase